MRLTAQERETIVNFNEAEGKAYVFTYNKSWQKHLEQKLGLKPVNVNGFGGRDYELPKKMIKPPKPPRKVSQKQREAARTTMHKIHSRRQQRIHSAVCNTGTVP